MKRINVRVIRAVVLGLCFVLLSQAAGGDRRSESVVIDRFEAEPTEEGLPPQWEPLFFEDIPRHTAYSVRTEDENSYLHAEAERSASALVKRSSFRLKDYPVMKWRWRIEHVLEKGDARTKAGDDYAARVYINFKYDPDRVGVLTRVKYALAKRKTGEYPPLYSLNYIWANKLERGTIRANAYTDRAMMVAVESGPKKAGRWVAEERNAYEDFKDAFGEEPTPVIGIAVMTDTDNTGERTSGDYDDIRFVAAQEGEEAE